MNLLQIARTNIRDAKIVISTVTDEGAIRTSAFACQQAVEKTLKFILEISGNAYPRTHSISELIVLLRRENIGIPNDIIAVSRILTTWENRSRYLDEFRTTYNEVCGCLNVVDNFIEEVAITYNILIVNTFPLRNSN